MAIANPYLNDQANAITQQTQQNFLQSVLPQMRRGNVAAGGWGNSGAGIAQGIAAGNAATGLSANLANLYGQSWESDQNRQNQMAMQQAALANASSIAAMQDATNRYGLENQYKLGTMQDATNRYGLTNQYNLGLGNIELGNKNADYGFYTQQRGQDITQQQGAANQYLATINAMAGLNNSAYLTGQQAFNEPINALVNYSNQINPYTGLNSTQTNTGPATGGGVAGAVGGGLTAAQLIQLLLGGG